MTSRQEQVLVSVLSSGIPNHSVVVEAQGRSPVEQVARLGSRLGTILGTIYVVTSPYQMPEASVILFMIGHSLVRMESRCRPILCLYNSYASRTRII